MFFIFSMIYDFCLLQSLYKLQGNEQSTREKQGMERMKDRLSKNPFLKIFIYRVYKKFYSFTFVQKKKIIYLKLTIA